MKEISQNITAIEMKICLLQVCLGQQLWGKSIWLLLVAVRLHNGATTCIQLNENGLTRSKAEADKH